MPYCPEAAQEHAIISCFSFLPSLVHRMMHAHPLSHLGLFLYEGAHTASCSHAGTQTCSFPSYLRSCLLKKHRDKVPSFIYSECNFARVACVIRHGWWGCNIRHEPDNLQRASLKEFMNCYTTEQQVAGILRLFLWEERVKYIISRALCVSRLNLTDVAFDILLVMIGCARVTQMGIQQTLKLH